MRFDILTIFPEYFDVLKTSVIGRALGSGKFEVFIHNIRDYTKDKHLKTDDTPYGGGAGMLMTPDPIVSAIEAVDPNHEATHIYMSPKGNVLKQRDVIRFAESNRRILILCGNYEGVDQRVVDLCIDREISIGDYVLTGGELPALVLVNAVSRYIEGVLGSSESTGEESFSNGLLEYPQYTRPAVYKGVEVPAVLQNGNHAEIEKWRLEKSVEATIARRPELFSNIDITPFISQKNKRKPHKKH